MRRVAVTVIAAIAVIGLGGLAVPVSGSAEASSGSDVIAVVIDGTGNGHGRGMSQWGAYGWAVDEGKDWMWILDHYYGGTVLGDVDNTEGRIRVRLIALDGAAEIGVVSGAGGVQWDDNAKVSMFAREIEPDLFEVFGSSARACPSTPPLEIPTGPIAVGPGSSDAVRQMQTFLNAFRTTDDATLTVDGEFGPVTNARLVDWQTAESLPADGVWDTDDAIRADELIGESEESVAWTSLGTTPGPVTFTKPNGEDSAGAATSAIGVCDSSGSVTHYRGQIEVRSEDDGLRVVNDVKTEDYLRGVVPVEVSASWADDGDGAGMEAVMAQAVAARSYGLEQDRYPYASTCDSQSCQVYRGAAHRVTPTATATVIEDPRTDAAIAETVGKIRKWPDDSIVSTEFSASNGPRTAGGAFPAVDDAPGDGTAKNRYHRWTRIVDAETFAAEYGLDTITGVSSAEAENPVLQQFDGIWANDIVITGTGSDTGGDDDTDDGAETAVRVDAGDFRSDMGLRSTGFTVRVVTDDMTGQSLGIIGDSIGNLVAGSSSAELRKVLAGTFELAQIDVATRRCVATTACTGSSPESSGVDAATKLPDGLDLVVVQLGYDDETAGFDVEIDRMMTALNARDVQAVAWVNMADPTPPHGTRSYAEENAALQAAQSRWPNLTVLDWAAATDNPERGRWIRGAPDDLSATGESEYALWLRAELLALLTQD